MVPQLTVSTLASVTDTFFSDTFPVFVTTNRYEIVEPAVTPDGAPACLSNVMPGEDVIVEVAVSVEVTGGPDGGTADSVAVLTTCPASTSAWVSVYVAVQVVCSPGASVVVGQNTEPTMRSVTLSRCIVTLPVLRAWNV